MKLSKILIGASLAAFLAMPGALANTLRWASARDVLTLDPYAVNQTALLNHVYEGLVRFDKNFRIEPALAESWKIIEPTVWQFTLRKGVKFHNGEAFTADDVIASLRRITHELSPLRGNLSSFKDARKVDDLTVEITLNRVNPLFLNDLTGIFIMSAKWLAENQAEIPADLSKGRETYASRHTNGTGPFILTSFQPDVKTVLTVNPNWWDKPEHNLTTIEYLPVASPATRISGLLAKQLDFVDSAPLQDLPRLDAASDIKVLKSTELRTVFFLPSMKEMLFETKMANPLRDVRVRKALYQAIDINQIQRRVMRGLSRNAGTVVAPALPGYSPDLDGRFSVDQAAAKKLLAEAGYPNGFSMTLVCATDFYVNEEELCVTAATMWARIGVKVNLSSGTRSVQYAKQVKGDFDMTILGWSGEPPIDSFSVLSQVVHSKTNQYGVYNWGGWSVPAIDQKIEMSASELDQTKRAALMNDALKAVRDEVMFIPLHQQPIAWAARNDVVDVLQMPDNRPRHWFTRMR